MILISAQDVGPAKYISFFLKKIKIKYLCIASKLSKKVFDSHNIRSVLSYDEINFTDFKLVITGTCLNECIDKKILIQAKENNIKTISIIEHWSLYMNRFLLNNKKILPDYIFVNDDLAKQESINEGIPEKKIVVIGNPYLENLKKKGLVKAKKKDKFFSQSRKVITFISESIKDDFQTKNSNLYGFNEFSILEDIIEISEMLNHKLLIKLHPTESKYKYKKYLNNNVQIYNLKLSDPIIEFSDYIIGMGSMFLIEASLFRKDIIAYRPNEKIKFVGEKLNIVTTVKTKKKLINSLRSKIGNNKSCLYFENSLDKITNFISKIYFKN